ncbi:MAG TPA: GspH/FimT family pseudopilin [Dissulfurispiraceae bacterium]|nr:GspH/FimT family pseudopilin [Dissulfurispiraceae bacterium]
MRTALSREGFTLLEMMMVIFLIGLILAISVAMLANTLPSQKVDATAREMIATFRLARSAAMTSGQWRVLTLDMDSRQFGLEGGAQRPIPEDVTVEVKDPLYGEIKRGGYRFVFAPSGVSEGGTIVLSAGTKTVDVDVDPIVGAVYSYPK